ncbi:MAG: DUF362 domain-containing protein [bacterium]
MKSKVYFVEVKDIRDVPESLSKLHLLIKKSGGHANFRPEWNVAIKTHFGEEGNTGFVKPPYVRAICKAIKGKGATGFLSDANTLYRGRRLNSVDHVKLAAEHGFTRESVGVDIVVPDCSKKENTVEIPLHLKYVSSAKIARVFADADALVVITHFKGHALSGFGGSIKNVGMGCATREGKLAQHCDIAPVIFPENCIGCGECVNICPVGALTLVDSKSSLDRSKCIGCASCIAVCPTMALFVDMDAGEEMQKKMVEYAFAVLHGKKNKCAFFNFAVSINKECDCWGLENFQIAPDVGILASCDPVSIDKASFDLVNSSCGKDIFHEAHPDYDGIDQLKHAQSIGLGNLDYELIRL